MQPAITISAKHYTELCKKPNSWTKGPIRVEPSTYGITHLDDKMPYPPKVPTWFNGLLLIVSRHEEHLEMGATNINITNCPNLKTVAYPQDGKLHLCIKDCPQLDYQRIPTLGWLETDNPICQGASITTQRAFLHITHETPLWDCHVQAKMYSLRYPPKRLFKLIFPNTVGKSLDLAQWQQLQVIVAINQLPAKQIAATFPKDIILAAVGDIEKAGKHRAPRELRAGAVALVKAVLHSIPPTVEVGIGRENR